MTGRSSTTPCSAGPKSTTGCRSSGPRTAPARLERPGMVAGRADVIVGGVLVLAAVMEVFDRASCLVSEDDILDGLVATLRLSQPRCRSRPAILTGLFFNPSLTAILVVRPFVRDCGGIAILTWVGGGWSGVAMGAGRGGEGRFGDWWRLTGTSSLSGDAGTSGSRSVWPLPAGASRVTLVRRRRVRRGQGHGRVHALPRSRGRVRPGEHPRHDVDGVGRSLCRGQRPRTSWWSWGHRSTSTSTPIPTVVSRTVEDLAPHLRDGQLLVLALHRLPGHDGPRRAGRGGDGEGHRRLVLSRAHRRGQGDDRALRASPDRLGPHRIGPGAGREALRDADVADGSPRARGSGAGQALHQHMAVHQVRHRQPAVHDGQ